MNRVRRPLVRVLFDAVWQTPLWALPFALFFGTMYGASREAYLVAYEVSLVFALTIRVALVVLERVGLPALCRPGERLPLPVEIALFAGTSVAASYVAALIIHFTFLPGFMGNARAIALTGMYALVFSFLIGGIVYATHFYRQSIARARAVEAMRAELAQAELRALKAQIEPHFLFNTLNSIASLIASDPRAAEEMTTRLAELFRYALSASERETAPLADEIAFARAYLDIERVRFGDRLRVETDVDPALERVLVPSLLLQPVVENAVRHGVAPRAEGGRIRVTARRAGAGITITVEDDGPGIAPDLAARLASGEASTSRTPGSRGFGLFALRERLRAAGYENALSIDAPAGGGTRVAITLPLAPA